MIPKYSPIQEEGFAVEATTAHRTAEVESTETMNDHVEERFDIISARTV